MKKMMYLIAFSALMVGCSSSGKFKTLTADNLSVEPKVLELKGEEVTATIKGTFPAKFFPKDGELEFTPVLVSKKKTIKGDKAVFFGENIKHPGLLIVSNKDGGTFTETQSFPYSEEMRVSELYADVKVKKGKKTINSSRIKLADGVITTPLLVDVGEASMMSRDFYGPATTNAIETGTIQYQLAKSDLRESEIIKPEIQNLIKNLKASGKRSYIEITSAASPEGAERINTSLATHRDMEATQYLEREMKKSNIELPIKHTLIDEDWDGLYKNIEASNMPDKNRMIQEMKAEGNLDKRQVILHKYMASNGLYEASLLPPLRRSKITLHVVNEEKLRTIDIHSNTPAHAIIESASDRKISNLTLEDRLAVTAAMADPDERIKSYRAIIIQHPNDWRAYNNLATVYLDKKDWNEASKLIDHSIKVQEHPENRYNQGFIHLAKGNMTDAKTCFSKAVASSSPEWKNARGAAEILNGNYSKAVATYGDQVCNNAALAQILNKDYSKAASTLSNIGAPNATTYYLKAIVGARTNNKDMVYNNLKEVMARNTQLGNWAKTDVEFAHYMGDSRFTSILQ